MELANSIVTLQPGMYILRHPKTSLPPLSISRAAGSPAHTGSIQALYTPGTDGGVLRDGKDCVVMQVLNAPVDLLVTAYLEKIGVAVPSLKIDKITLEGDAAPTSAKSIEVPAKGISIIAHIERTGDVVASNGKLLGSPDGNLRLEGFQVMWPDKPEGIDLAYSVKVEGAPETPPVTTGNFCGTRNVARRLVGALFRLTGDKAARYKVTGQVHFSGGFTTAIENGVHLQGPTGLEHITALRIDVSSADTGTTKPAPGPWEPSSRTRVMKTAKRGKK